jgi:UDP-glucose:(heptosyl)LPS alpha-1,3-glucosyltransferase
MKVALVLEKFSIARGGAERSTFELACRLSESGVDVTLIAGRIDRPDRTLPCALHELPRSGGNLRRWQNFQRAASRHLAQTHYDIVHSMVPLLEAHIYQPRGGSILNSSRRHAASYESALLRFVKRGTGWFNRPRQARIRAERQLCRIRRGPLVAALSTYVAQAFQNDYQLPPDRLRIVPNGIDTAALRNENARAGGERLRQLYSRDGQFALFLFAAENYRLKGLRWLIRAAKHAHSRLTPSQRDFRIIVAGSENYEKYWKDAQTIATEPHVLFLGSTQEMPALINMCDAVVLPTYNDACSRLILEGLAAGKPGITTRYNGAADFLGEGKYGVIIDSCDDVEALAEALLCLCDPRQQQDLSRRIEADRLHERVSMARHARELLAWYEEIVRTNPVPH